MRLLNTSTIALEEFYGSAIPEYAILSHRWLDGEVSFQDLQSGQAPSKAGYAKIKLCCEQAAKDGLAYAWVDTCCIDKTSSAELNEAINSMYAWYRESAICYAFLSDVQSSSADDSFDASAWFTRGWTLQELIAPAHVVFYNATWQLLGTRDEEPLTERISTVTNIDAAILRGEASLRECSVAQRMSWAAGRTTTRLEDRAYSLLGLFGVNMPMLYGEGGARAFLRLQEEIMKASDDQSLFAWGNDSDQLTGLLASSPADFAGCADVVVARQRWNHQPYSMTNRGLSLEMPMVPWGMETFMAALDCEVAGEANSRIGIYLRMLPENEQFARVRFRDEVAGENLALQTFAQSLAATTKYRKIYVRQRDTEPARPRKKRATPGGTVAGSAAASNTITVPVHTKPSVAAPRAEPTPVYGFYIRTVPVKFITVPDPSDKNYPLSEVYLPPGGQEWDDDKRIVTLPPGGGGTVAALYLRTKDRSYTLKVGFDDNFNPIAQYGGMLSSPGVRPPIPHNSVEAMMHPSWMTVPRSDYLFRGDRLRGGLDVKTFPWRVRMQYDVVGDKKMWVLDIEDS